MNLFLPTTGVLSSATHLVFLLTKTFRTLLLASGLLIVFSMQANAQDESWTLQTTINNVDFFHKLVDCEDRKAVLIKFDNKNSYDVKVSWKHVIGTKLIPNTTEESPENFEITVQAGISEPSDCADEENGILVVLPFEVDPAYVAQIQNFSFSSITVEEIN